MEPQSNGYNGLLFGGKIIKVDGEVQGVKCFYQDDFSQSKTSVKFFTCGTYLLLSIACGNPLYV
jgi:hypothetical protein